MREVDLSNILLGTATAATQIEGGDRANSWYDWAEAGHIKDGSSPVRACGHFERFREDIAIMKSMNMRVYRLGVEWSRIQPERDKFDADAILVYRDLLGELIAAGIKPLVTLHHFTNPRWFEQAGGFTAKDSPDAFISFVRYTVDALKDLCSEWVTINEPNVYAAFGYFYGTWPPGHKSFKETMSVFRNMAISHVRAYDYIHSVQPGASVGIAQHYRVFEPLRPKNIIDKLGARAMTYIFQDMISDTMAYGKSRFPLKRLKVKRGRYFDFLGVNYYSRFMVKGFEPVTKPGTPLNDLGWEIYPDGLKRVCLKYQKRYKMPIYITENGTCDNSDAFRAQFLYTHLAAVADANAGGANVERYYHWSFMDNFEWLEGEEARFGLVHIDYETGTRNIKDSGRFYADIAKEGRITKELLDKHSIKE